MDHVANCKVPELGQGFQQLFFKLEKVSSRLRVKWRPPVLFSNSKYGECTREESPSLKRYFANTYPIKGKGKIYQENIIFGFFFSWFSRIFCWFSRIFLISRFFPDFLEFFPDFLDFFPDFLGFFPNFLECFPDFLESFLIFSKIFLIF